MNLREQNEKLKDCKEDNWYASKIAWAEGTELIKTQI